jgi:hypothetical protein
VTTSQPLFAVRASAQVSKGSAVRSSGDATVIAFGTSPETRIACEHAAGPGGAAVLEVRHLQATCRALSATPAALLVLGGSLRPWDREVAEEHARRAGVRTVDEASAQLADLVRQAGHRRFRPGA